MDRKERTECIRELSRNHGFDFCGFSRAEFLEEEARNLEEWLRREYQGKMSYLEGHFDKRLDPTELVPGAKSVISLVYNYYPEKPLENNNAYKIAKYAYGEDYHFVIKRKLRSLVEAISEQMGDINGRVFVDSAPVMERSWAQRSGLGWIGKNTLLLNRSMGSFFFLAEIISDLELEPDHSIPDYCGTCTRCLDSCPTDAFSEPYVLDASKCISYLTIELKDELPDGFEGQMEDWIFGCDICQDVCPWNRFSRAHQEPAFSPKDELRDLNKSDWEEMTYEVFRVLTKNSPLKRTGFNGIKRNIQYQNKKA